MSKLSRRNKTGTYQGCVGSIERDGQGFRGNVISGLADGQQVSYKSRNRKGLLAAFERAVDAHFKLREGREDAEEKKE
jgi:hypothetical protein